MTRALPLLALSACHWAGWGQVCLGGTTTPSEACIVADGTYAGVAGAHALTAGGVLVTAPPPSSPQAPPKLPDGGPKP